jgi:hypothetical protein
MKKFFLSATLMLVFSVLALSTQAQTAAQKPIEEKAKTEVTKDSKVEKAGCGHSHEADHKCTGKCAGKAKDGKCCSGKTAATGCCSSKKADAKADGTKEAKHSGCKGSEKAAKPGCCSSKK